MPVNTKAITPRPEPPQRSRLAHYWEAERVERDTPWLSSVVDELEDQVRYGRTVQQAMLRFVTADEVALVRSENLVGAFDRAATGAASGAPVAVSGGGRTRAMTKVFGGAPAPCSEGGGVYR